MVRSHEPMHHALRLPELAPSPAAATSRTTDAEALEVLRNSWLRHVSSVLQFVSQ